MKRTIKLKESELINIIKKIINEQMSWPTGVGPAGVLPYQYPESPQSKPQSKVNTTSGNKTTPTANKQSFKGETITDKDGGKIIRLAGDRYEYKELNGKYFTKLRNESSWREVTSTSNKKAFDAIVKNVFGKDPNNITTSTTQTSSETPTQSFKMMSEPKLNLTDLSSVGFRRTKNSDSQVSGGQTNDLEVMGGGPMPLRPDEKEIIPQSTNPEQSSVKGDANNGRTIYNNNLKTRSNKEGKLRFAGLGNRALLWGYGGRDPLSSQDWLDLNEFLRTSAQPFRTVPIQASDNASHKWVKYNPEKEKYKP